MTDASEGESASTWARLRRRKVAQWSVAYAAGAWGLLQGLQFLAEVFGWQTGIVRVATLAFAVGLPIAMVLAWYHGERGAQRVTRSEFTVLAVLLLLGGGIVWWFGEAPHQPSALAPSMNHAPVIVADEKSIAVLPFADLSSSHDQEYFADGLVEELLARLSRVSELTVISRTSSFKFKGTGKSVREIASALGVAYVLEGSVRKSGDRFRVSAQLIDARTDTEVWSESYDRAMTDVFQTQDEIASRVVGALSLRLLGDTTAKRPTAVSDAYDAFLQGQYYERAQTAESFERAVELYRRALKLDPEYAQAWVRIAGISVNQAMRGLVPVQEGVREAQTAIGRALALDSSIPEAYSMLAKVAVTFEWDWVAADRALARAQALAPDDHSADSVAFQLLSVQGRLPEAIKIAERMVAENPLGVASHSNLGLAHYFAKNWQKSVDAFERAKELSPKADGLGYFLAIGYAMLGEPGKALEAARLEPGDGWRLTAEAIALEAAGDSSASAEKLEQLIVGFGNDWPFQIAIVLATRGNRDDAFRWLDRAYEARDAGITTLKVEPLIESLRDDPRYSALLRKMQLQGG